MREIRTSGSMSGERKRSDGLSAPSNRASPRLYPYGASPYAVATRSVRCPLRINSHPTIATLSRFHRKPLANAAR